MEQIEKLIDMAVANGSISDAKRQLILNKANELGIDPTLVEMMILNKIESSVIPEVKAETIQEVKPTDLYDIEDAELLQRCTKWVNRCSEKVIKIYPESFPKYKPTATAKFMDNVASGISKVGEVVFNKDVQNAVVKFANINFATKAALKTVQALTGTGETEFKHSEILEIAKSYLLILESRARHDDFLKEKYDYLTIELDNRIKMYEERRNKSFFGKFK